MRSIGFWCEEVLLVGLCVAFYLTQPAWTMWREGSRIKGPIVAVEESSARARVTVRDPATELTYTARQASDNHDVGTIATVIVHPTDRSKVLTPTDVYLGVVAQIALLLATIAYPITAMVVHRRSRAVDGPASRD